MLNADLMSEGLSAVGLVMMILSAWGLFFGPPSRSLVVTLLSLLTGLMLYLIGAATQ